MFAAVKTGIGSAVMPLPLAFLLAALGVLLLWRQRHRAGMTLIGVAMLGLLALSWAPIADRLLGPIEAAQRPLEDARTIDSLDAIVVLSGGWTPDDHYPITSQLNASTLIRLTEGMRLWQQRPELRLVVTGGSRDPSQPGSALGMAEAARALGVAADRIVILDGPLDTAQEARAVRAALGADAQLIVVTSASHMRRALRHFERVGLVATPAPTAFKVSAGPHSVSYWMPSSQHLRKSERAIYERLGMLALPLDH